MKILIATDGSEASKTMTKEFAERTFAPNTKIRVISIYERSSSLMNADQIGVWSVYYAEADQNAVKSAKNIIENAATILRKKNPKLSITTAAIEGSPKTVILKEAEKFGADLIVVGSHGHGAIAGFLMGSVSQAVALHAKCSVEIVRKAKKLKAVIK